MGLLEKMQFSIDTMTFGERLLGSIVVTFLGVGIVFIALIMLYFTIIIMQKGINGFQPKNEAKIEPISKELAVENITDTADTEDSIDNTELVAVITAAVAASLNTSTHNIVVRNITRTTDMAPSWSKIGRINQINSKL